MFSKQKAKSWSLLEYSYFRRTILESEYPGLYTIYLPFLFNSPVIAKRFCFCLRYLLFPCVQTLHCNPDNRLLQAQFLS